MIIGIGTDIIEVARVGQALERFPDRYRQRVFTPAEQAYCDAIAKPLPHFAARWAAKESAVKALGTGFSQGIRWVEVEVARHPSGQPLLRLHGKAAEVAREMGVRSAHLTLSHNREHATATVVLDSEPADEARSRFVPYAEGAP